jgi:hypothetical protein
MVASKNNEEFVYQAVLTGELEIRPDGTIWRMAAARGDRWNGGSKLIPCTPRRAEHDAGKYFQIRLMRDGKRVYAQAHRLVFRHFKGPIPEGMTVNHEDGQHKNNPPDNLELATYAEQQVHANRVLGTGAGANQAGEANHQAKLTDAQVAEIRRRRAARETLQSIADDFGIAMQTVSKITRGDRRAA